MSDNSLDLAGVGEIAKAIPDDAWEKLVNTACVTFEKSLAPFTETTSGFGRLISEAFNLLSEAQKIIASDLLERLSDRVKDKYTGQFQRVAKSSVVIEAIELSSKVDNEDFLEMWVNLLKREFLKGDVHPSFPSILSQLSPIDATVLTILGESINISTDCKTAWEVSSMTSNSFLKFKSTSEEDKEKQRLFNEERKGHEFLTNLIKQREAYIEQPSCDLSFYLLDRLGLIATKDKPSKKVRINQYELSVYGRSFYSTVLGKH